MRRLTSGIPRALTNHKTPEGALYGRYGRAWVQRFGGELPEDVRQDVRLGGRLCVEIQALEADYDALRTRRRLAEARRVRRSLTAARSLFLKVQARLEERAAKQGPQGALKALAGI